MPMRSDRRSRGTFGDSDARNYIPPPKSRSDALALGEGEDLLRAWAKATKTPYIPAIFIIKHAPPGVRDALPFYDVIVGVMS